MRKLFSGAATAVLLTAVIVVMAAGPDCHTANCGIWQPWEWAWWDNYCYLPKCPDIITRAWHAVLSVL